MRESLNNTQQNTVYIYVCACIYTSEGMIYLNRVSEILCAFLESASEEVDLIFFLGNDSLQLIVLLLKVWYNDNIKSID